ncbi:ABC transporter permease [Aureimonas pseudogalii]|uniref:Autoinducer 2 import system permease protein LsrC n=1 Tax=Aureimonas pseudogalii TaxID=1744844 RepID=A0A7W6H838_9HYPH|nr:ABC transporter permease [Aureimonas pseudogalii]MBB4000321.1 ribose transport system permease protein [Aureimonas pseudogalii]
MAHLADRLSGRYSRHGLWILPLGVGLAGIVGLALMADDFLSPQNLFNLAAQAAPLLLVSIGQMLVVLVRGLDLSVGSMISLTTAIVSLDASPWATIPGAFAAAVLVGLVNGVTVVRLNVHPIIATLSVTGIIQGITLFVRPVAGGTIPEIVTTLVREEVFGVPMPVFWVVLAIGLGWKLLHGSRFGLHLFAIGGGDTAHSFGIPDRRNTILAFVACSVFAALAGLFLAGRIASGDPNIGTQYAVDSITAVALGGTQLAGGVGSLQGTVIGTVLLALLANGMNLLNLSAFVQTAVKGLILLAVISIQPRKSIGL